MSQASDYPLSLSREDSDSLLLNLQSSDDVDLFTEQSFTQQTNESTTSRLGSECLLAPTVPASLTYVGPELRKTWLLYEMDKKTDFIEWWLQTSSRREAPQDTRFRFDTDATKAQIWQHYDQVAHYTSGEPKVMCRRCSKVLDHPNWTRNGTNSLRRHWASEKCQNSLTKASRNRRQPHIQRLIEEAVSLRLNFISLSSFIK